MSNNLLDITREISRPCAKKFEKEFIRKENKEINEKKMKGETVIAVSKRFKRRAEK